MLLAYSLGLGIPFVLCAVLIDKLKSMGNIKKSENKLIYGDYLNSNGEIEEVLLQIKEKTKF